MTTDQSAVDRAKDTASTATDQGKQVGSVAKDEAQNVVGTAAEQARHVANDTMSQLREQLTEQTSGQRDRLVGALQSLGDDLERMAGEAPGSGMAADLAREGADKARALKAHLDGREPGQLLDDVRDLARRRPGTFLLGALAAGVVAGRLLRATADGAAAATLAPETGPADGLSATPPVPTSAPATPTSVAAAPSYGQPVVEAPATPPAPVTPSYGQPPVGTP